MALCPGDLSATFVASMEMSVYVVNDGDLKPLQEEPDVIDIMEAYTLYCSICHMLSASEYADHGIADDWQML
jgi:hypothetical protein